MTTLFLIASGAFAAILLIWIGYPILMWTVSSVIARSVIPNYERATSRRVSVVLATRDAATLIRARIANLLETQHPADHLEVIVARDADGAQFTPDELADVDARVRVVQGDAPGGKAAALNAGVRSATGEILVMADVAQRFDERTIPELVAALEDQRFDAVSGALMLGLQSGRLSPVHLYWSMEKWLRASEARVHSSVGVTGAVYATRRATWPVIPAGTLLDDVYVPMSLVLAGSRVGFTYAARAQDIRAFDAASEGTRKVRTLTGVLQLLHLVPGILSVRNPILVQLVMHKLARLATPALLLLTALASAPLLMIAAINHPMATLLPMLLLTAVVAAVPPLRRRVRGGVLWGVALQAATVRAIVNGVGGRWTVWAKTKQ